MTQRLEQENESNEATTAGSVSVDAGVRPFELRLFIVEDPRTQQKYYFRTFRNAYRMVEGDPPMNYKGQELFHTDYPMPLIEDDHG